MATGKKFASSEATTGTIELESMPYSNPVFQQPPPNSLRSTNGQRSSGLSPFASFNLNKSTIQIKDSECQLMSVEIEKDAEIGLVIGQIEGENWVFIDQILPNGMIDLHGILKEGDYLIQAGSYSLVNIDIPTALLAIECAYDEGRKSLPLVAARRGNKPTKF